MQDTIIRNHKMGLSYSLTSMKQTIAKASLSKTDMLILSSRKIKHSPPWFLSYYSYDLSNCSLTKSHSFAHKIEVFLKSF